MMKKIILCLCLSLLCGCSSEGGFIGSDPSSQVLIYEGNNGEQTYKEAVKFFNDNVRSYEEYIIKNDTELINSYYRHNGGIDISEVNIYSYQGLSTLSYTCYKGEKLYVLYLGEYDYYQYEELDENYLNKEKMYDDILVQEGYRVLEIDRYDLKDEVKLVLKIEDSHAYNIGGEFGYMIKEIYINQEGYIYKEEISYYSDANFKEEIDGKETIYYNKINDLKYTSIDNEIDMIKKCDGLSFEEIKVIIGL